MDAEECKADTFVMLGDATYSAQLFILIENIMEQFKILLHVPNIFCRKKKNEESWSHSHNGVN